MLKLVQSFISDTKIRNEMTSFIKENSELIEEKVRENRLKHDGEIWFQLDNYDIQLPENLSDNTFSIYPTFYNKNGFLETDIDNWIVMEYI